MLVKYTDFHEDFIMINRIQNEISHESFKKSYKVLKKFSNVKMGNLKNEMTTNSFITIKIFLV